MELPFLCQRSRGLSSYLHLVLGTPAEIPEGAHRQRHGSEDDQNEEIGQPEYCGAPFSTSVLAQVETCHEHDQAGNHTAADHGPQQARPRAIQSNPKIARYTRQCCIYCTAHLCKLLIEYAFGPALQV